MRKAIRLKALGLVGLVMAEDIIHPETRAALVYAGTRLTEVIVLGLIENFGVDEFRVYEDTAVVTYIMA